MKFFYTFYLFLLSVLLIGACDEIAGSSESANALSDEAGSFSIASAGDEGLSEEQQLLYREDAERLAIRFINGRDSTQTNIPERLIQNLYNGLVHIVNSDLQKTAEVTETYQIHAREPGSPREVLVSADSAAPWVDAWRNGMTKTENPKIDELIDQFDFSLAEYNELQNLPQILTVLRSKRAVNVLTVSRLFAEHPDVEDAFPNTVSDGSEITALLFDDHLRYTFEYGFGDCPSGCINRHSWKFKVFTDGTVEFIEENGDPLPDG
jgi:hypothetical protein